MGAARIILALAMVVAISGRASAENLAIADVHGEADVADEAGAVTLLVRTALEGQDRTLLGAPPGFTVVDPKMLSKIGADHGLAMELSREGTGLRVTVVLVGGTTGPDVLLIRAGDGDVYSLAKGIVDHVTTTLKLEPGRGVPTTPLGQLRPYVQAIRLKPNDAAAAATVLSDVSVRTMLAVPAAGVPLRGLPEATTPVALAVIAARAIGDVEKLDAIGAGKDGPAIASRAFAAIHRAEVSKVEQALAGKLPNDGLVALARVTLAESRSDDKVLGDRIVEGLASDQQRAVLALASTVVPSRLSIPVHRALLATAEKAVEVSPGVVSRIGLNAAEQGVEVARALALVSVRELDEFDVKKLEPLVAKQTSLDGLRLKAELAMRHADGSEPIAVGAYVRAAPNDPRAHRYHGWLLVSEYRQRDAAAAFAKAVQIGEQARALMMASDFKGALTTLGRDPQSAEELVMAARQALLDKDPEKAGQLISLAEQQAPANPLVHLAVLELLVQKPDPARGAIARLIVEKGSTIKSSSLPTASVISLEPEGSGSDETTGSESSNVQLVGVDPRPLAPLLAQLPGLKQVENGRLMLVEQPWDAPIWALRTTHSPVLRDGLTKLLQAQPYKLKVSISPTAAPDTELRGEALARLIGDADALLVYRSQPAGGDASIRLVLYKKGATDYGQIVGLIDMEGLVIFNVMKLVLILAVLATIITAIILWYGRSMGRVKVIIERDQDVVDEALCIQISKSEVRPVIDDAPQFHALTKKVGAITKPRHATLITSGQSFRIPTGKWHVHLYGTFARGGRFRQVPETATQTVELRRGDHAQLTFNLAAKQAEICVAIESTPREGIAVWANNNDRNKILTDEAGEAMLYLPIGNHVIHIEAQGRHLKKQLYIGSHKIERISFNVNRELRILEDADLAGDDDHAQPAPIAMLGAELGPPDLVDPQQDHAATPIQRTMLARPQGSDLIPPTHAATQSIESVQSSAGPPKMTDPLHLSRLQIPSIGQLLLGRYRILKELGRGAMGVVNHAWDQKLEREVAIKEMADELRKNPDAMRLFSQEAKALAQLNHTNIVAMYDQVTDVDRVYMIMEFVDGKPLESLVAERGALPWKEAIAIIDQVLTGLAYAHARKVIHRDIKPANIFVNSDGTVKLGDFGLARVMREVTIRKTEIRGTPLYMAPEQITGSNVDHRADLYAVGCTLFELVCGRPPYIEGDILYAQLYADAPAASQFMPDIPPALDKVLIKMIAKKSEDRFESANDVRKALENMVETA